MKRSSREAGFIKALMVVVVGFCVLFIVFAALAKYLGPGASSTFSGLGSLTTGNTTGSIETRTNPLLDFGNSGNYTLSGDSRTNTSGSQASGQSAYAGKVSLSIGNANSSSQPFQEYVSIRNSGAAVSITGWTLTNNKGSRPIQNSQNSYFYPTQDVAIIGQGTEFLDPSGRFVVGPITLKSGDSAIVTTGGPFTQYSYPIPTSFRVNICVGYLSTHPFEPRITKQCPYITRDASIGTVTDECYDYIASLNRCTDPQKTDKEEFDEQPSHCRNFLVTRTNYPGCVAFNRNSADFLTKQWRIFLGKKAELWAAKRETITLYDSKGLIVDQISY
jgi:hypothetical protein